ncbi:MAG: type II secretion system F family protein [Pseudomonadota bacterium]|nr:type II secretion system F family protein [Pseudomonadota bacterium]
MALYRYKAVAPTGETLVGEMEAGSRDEVVVRLQDAGNVPIEAAEAGSGGGMALGALFKRSALGGNQLALFTSQLGTLLGAGQPLDRALHTLSENSESDEARVMITRIKDGVRSGTPLSTTLEQQHGVFSRLYVNMVRAGEVSGSLTDTLKRLAEYLERSRQLRATVINALIYPAILVGMVILTLFILMIFVIPNFQPIFEELGNKLPLITKIVLFVASTLQNFWWLIALIGFGAFWFVRKQYAVAESRQQIENWLLSLRAIGTLVAKVETARLARTLGTLVQNGVPLLTALTISKNVMGNTVLADAVAKASEEVKTGSGLAFALGVSKRFPKLALSMIAVGEESGELDGMLYKVADTFDADVKNTIERLLAGLVPAITAIMAVMVGMIMLSIVLPLLELSSLVE